MEDLQRTSQLLSDSPGAGEKVPIPGSSLMSLSLYLNSWLPGPQA